MLYLALVSGTRKVCQTDQFMVPVDWTGTRNRCLKLASVSSLLDAMWLVCSWSQHILSDGISDPPVEAEICGSKPLAKTCNCIFLITRWQQHPSSILPGTELVLLLVLVYCHASSVLILDGAGDERCSKGVCS